MSKNSANPDLSLERELFSSHKYVVGIDEVGRGAYAGPVTVGVCIIDSNCISVPTGLKDSKLLTAVNREKLKPLVEQWAVAAAIGDAQPEEIDEVGMTAALRLAANRALNSLEISPDVAILDGSHDWLTPPTRDLFSDPPVEPEYAGKVIMKVKADMSCASVAAASVVAKVHRDGLMRKFELEYPGYSFSDNAGYGTSAHRDAIAKLGLTKIHRHSWKLTE